MERGQVTGTWGLQKNANFTKQAGSREPWKGCENRSDAIRFTFLRNLYVVTVYTCRLVFLSVVHAGLC